MVEREEKRRKGEEEVSPLYVDPRCRTCSPASGRPFKGPSTILPPVSLLVLYSSSALVSTEQMKCFLIRDIPR